jgi:hypothetical protein
VLEPVKTVWVETD